MITVMLANMNEDAVITMNWIVILLMMHKIFFCILTGLGVTGLLVWITEYYTSTEFTVLYDPSQRLLKRVTVQT